MKIIVNARFLTQPITGVQRFAIEISLRLKKELGEKIMFVSPKEIIQNELAKELQVNTIGYTTSHLWEQIELPLYLKKKGSPLLLNFCNTAPLLYKNKISTIHDIAFEVYPETYSKTFLNVYRFLIPKICKNSKKIITVSDFSKQEIIKYYKTKTDKIQVIYNAVNDGFIYNENIELKNQKYFLAVSSLNYRKNLPFVLDSFIEFIKDCPDYKLYLIGGMDTKSFSKLNLSKYTNHPNIIFLGRVSDEDLILYYSNAVAFIYPSLYEGFGIPPLEAQKCGTPVILSNLSCFPEIFGQSVLYCDVDNINSLVKQMNLILEKELRDNIKKLGEENEKKYNWDLSANCLMKNFNNFDKS